MINENNELYRVLTEDQSEDREGQTPAILFAYKIRKELSEGAEIDEIKCWMIEIAENIEELNLGQIQSFFFFLYSTKIKTDELFVVLKSKLEVNFLQNNPESIKRRAEILRFIVNNSEFFTADELESEEYVKEKAPWYFFDCMVKRSEERAIIFLNRLLEEGVNLQQFLMRLPALRKDMLSDFIKILDFIKMNLKEKK
ncbi:MAG: hypothetical protein A2271_03600 [Candidatus Moranbacteria bacterium RIFOXYA12_FULL_35_19]|nr:MAG: hypothetical protein UR78_C0026G0013 [Candidatus Moranbacteria bacterium GW2011_GWF2_35_39]OGI31860.1 MAG: hypothetical protein A2343_01470 [Candidatus Moranbacteria bacterium RIFOXYB12_FULL_35_8]OGI33382.1 MAG: hypothetical protein A2489_04015 [Candidatus Moranbacteria bacterium RIFOXYC12_FULL_36_13]OGI36268.1 MAG: hypothetical protein A2271_03600 [Candidatus Moranbacteria bacterium RIFOXYA12_FULL_35_19]